MKYRKQAISLQIAVQKRDLNWQGWREIDKWKENRSPGIVSSPRFSMSRRGGGEIRAKRHWISRWIVRVGVKLLLPIKGMISGAWTRAAHSILFSKLLVSTRREEGRRVGIYSRRGVFFTLPATSARIDQLFIGRESGSTSFQEESLEWIKGKFIAKLCRFFNFFPLDLDRAIVPRLVYRSFPSSPHRNRIKFALIGALIKEVLFIYLFF